MNAVTGLGRITLAGRPRKVSAVVRLDPSCDRVVPVAIKLADTPSIFRASVRHFGAGTSEVRLRLPGETPPGRYGGEGQFAGERRALLVEVEPAVRIRVSPKQTVLTVDGGSTAEFALTVVNAGNVPLDVPKAAVFDLDDADAQDRALGRAMRAKLPEGERLVDRFFDEIRESHGGEAHLAVLEGSGRLEPGDTRTLRCQLVIPASAQAGRSYLGAWQLGNVSHLVGVVVKKSAPRK
jgi:hypothetical protein